MSTAQILPDAASADEVEGGQEDENQPMDWTEIQDVCGRIIRDAVVYSDSELSPARKQANDYYKTRPFGNEEEGRSQYISPEVRNTVQAVMPSFMRLFFGPERVVEYRPRRMEDRTKAEQATEYVNEVVLQQDNSGFLEVYAAIKDALIRRRGVIKWWWDDTITQENYHHTGLTEDQLILLEADPDIEYEVTSQEAWRDPRVLAAYTIAQREYDDAIDEGIPTDQLPPAPVLPDPISLFEADVVYTNPNGRLRISAVPPEEFLHSSDARSIEDAQAVIHRVDKTRSELLSLGVPLELLDEIQPAKDEARSSTTPSYTELKSSEEAIGRMPGENLVPADGYDDAGQDIPYFEMYVYIDVKGRDLTEHRKVRMVGEGMKLVDHELFPDRPFAMFEVDPEPHTMDGLSLADFVMDIQLVKSMMLRGVLDSLGFTLHPRTVAVEGEVNMEDVLNTEIGAVIRERQPGMVRELTTSFAGAAAFPYLGYFDEQKETATGQSKAAQGLDPNALQSSTRAAVAATVSAAQQRIDLFARMLVETGMKRMFAGILRTLVQHQQYPRQVRLRNEYTTVDPRVWDALMDVSVNVALGFTLTEERLAALGALSAKQEQVMSQMGLTNPVVTVGQMVNTYNKMAELSGFKDTTQFFQQVPIDWSPPPPEPEPTPEDKLADSQVAKVQLDAQNDAATLQLREKEIMLREERERDRNWADAYLKAKEIELKFQKEAGKVVAELEAKIAMRQLEKADAVTETE